MRQNFAVLITNHQTETCPSFKSSALTCLSDFIKLLSILTLHCTMNMLLLLCLLVTCAEGKKKSPYSVEMNLVWQIRSFPTLTAASSRSPSASFSNFLCVHTWLPLPVLSEITGKQNKKKNKTTKITQKRTKTKMHIKYSSLHIGWYIHVAKGCLFFPRCSVKVPRAAFFF